MGYIIRNVGMPGWKQPFWGMDLVAIPCCQCSNFEGYISDLNPMLDTSVRWLHGLDLLHLPNAPWPVRSPHGTQG